jgi:D-alanyl-D-alanine carboxypeptidase (penicillin-binding protein 5/6)
MQKRKKMNARLLPLIIFIMLIFILYGFIASGSTLFGTASERVPEQTGYTIHSRQAILVDLTTGKTLFRKQEEQRAYPASLTKIMTTLLAIEHIHDLHKTVPMPATVFADLRDKDASMAGFLPNEDVKIVDLLYGTLLPSGADASGTLAISVAGSEQAFVSMMNQKAAELGMRHTHFANDSGLQDPRHYTTAKDLSLLLSYALKNSTFRQVFTTKQHRIDPTNLHPDGIVLHSTLFQKIGSGQINGGTIIGGKTGYTDEAGLCLASLAKMNGHEYILITLGAPGNHSTTQYDIEDAYMIFKNQNERTAR